MRLFSFLLIAALLFTGGLLGCTPAPPANKTTAGKTDPSAAGPAAGLEEKIEQTLEPQPAQQPADDSAKSEAAKVDPAPMPAGETSLAKSPETATKKPGADIKAGESDPPQPVVAPIEVALGTAELTSGLPGAGPVKLEELKAFLDVPENHAPLLVKLPLGLSAGQGAIISPADNPLTKAKIELGRELYFDRRLSADATVSCADCHHPTDGFARATQFGVGIGQQTGNRNSPASYNRILSGPQFWDGRAASLEEQAKGPIANPIEMGNTHEVCIKTLDDIPAYQLQFKRVFPGEGVNIETVAKAIAAFERAIVTNPSPYDYYEPLRAFEKAFASDLEDLEAFKEDDEEAYEQYLQMKQDSAAHPMSDSAKRGREIFFGQKGSCTACHVGPNLSDEKYHNLGVGMDAAEPDLGRFGVTGEEKDKGAFKTPTIRNVALTAPYMHDGSQKTLEEVVEWYNKGGHPNPYLSKDVRKLNLTDEEKKDLVEFMKACTGDFTPVETGRLPE